MKNAKPNFLFLFPDQWRWDWLGCEGKIPLHTPHIDQLAARGTLLENVRTNCPICAPSRACLATGRRFHRAGVTNNSDELDPSLPNLFKALRQENYSVLTVGKSDLHTKSECFNPSGWHPVLQTLGFSGGVDYAGKWRGLHLMENKSPDAYGTFLVESGLERLYIEDLKARDRQRRTRPKDKISTAASPLPTAAHTDAFCAQSALRLLADTPIGNPWFLWVNFPGPHEPFDAPAQYRDQLDPTLFPGPIGVEPESIELHQKIRRNYAAAIHQLDDAVGAFIEALANRGEEENTYIIFASDHGELLGDHGLWYKQQPHEGSVHVPCIISGPNVPRNKRLDQLIELIDLNPTILEWAGLSPLQNTDARSITPSLRSHALTHRPFSITAHEKWRMIFDGRFKYCEYREGSRQLWDLQTDPNEQINLASRDEHRDLRNHLSETLALECPWFPDSHSYS